MADHNQDSESEQDGQTRVGHCKADTTDVYIGRGDNASNLLDTPIGERGWLGNPFVIESSAKETHRENPSITIVSSRGESIERFRAVFQDRLDSDEEFATAVAELDGEVLGCWCQNLNEETPACHGEVIAEYVTRLNEDSENQDS